MTGSKLFNIVGMYLRETLTCEHPGKLQRVLIAVVVALIYISEQH